MKSNERNAARIDRETPVTDEREARKDAQADAIRELADWEAVMVGGGEFVDCW